MDDGRLTNGVSEVEGERGRGRPRMGWLDGVENYVWVGRGCSANSKGGMR